MSMRRTGTFVWTTTIKSGRPLTTSIDSEA